MNSVPPFSQNRGDIKYIRFVILQIMSPSEIVKFSNVRGLYLRKYGMYFETDISSRKLMPQIIAPTVVNAQPLSLNVKETKNIFNYELSSFLFFSFFIQNLVFRFLFFVIQISSNYECFFTVLLLQRPYKLQICQTIFLCMKLKG